MIIFPTIYLEVQKKKNLKFFFVCILGLERIRVRIGNILGDGSELFLIRIRCNTDTNLGADIPESHAEIVLMDEIGRNAPVHDLAKYRRTYRTREAISFSRRCGGLVVSALDSRPPPSLVRISAGGLPTVRSEGRQIEPKFCTNNVIKSLRLG